MQRSLVVSGLILSMAFAAAFASPSSTGQEAAAAPGSTPVAMAPSALKWMPAPPVIPPGAQLAVLRGNPFAEGIFTIRLKIPPHYTFPPHWHPTMESFTVLKGPFFVGMGDTVDKSKATAIPAMGFASMPAMHHHYAYSGDKEVVIDLTGYGPFQIYYVNPADDPSQHAAKGH